MKQRDLQDFPGNGVVIGCNYPHSLCKSHPQKDFYTINTNKNIQPDLVLDLRDDFPEAFYQRFQLTILENLDFTSYNGAGSKGFENAMQMTDPNGFILITGCPRDKDYRRSVALRNLYCFELDKSVVLVPMNQAASLEEINQQIVSLDPALGRAIKAVNKNGELKFCHPESYIDMPCASMGIAELKMLSAGAIVNEQEKDFIQAEAVITILEAIDKYLENRDLHLGFFSKCFEYNRGLERANCYKKLLQESKSPFQAHLIVASLLANNEGIWLKDYVYKSLGYKDLAAARDEINKPLNAFKPADLKAINRQMGRLIVATNDGYIDELKTIPVPSSLRL